MTTASPERLISADDHVDVSHDTVKRHLASKYHGAYDAGLMAFAASMGNMRSAQANAQWREQQGLGEPDRPVGMDVKRQHAASGRPGHTNGAARLADMDVDGVEASVSYCEVSAFRYLYLIEDGWKESTRAFNLALADFAAQDPKRLIVNYQIPIHDIEAAVEEVRWAASAGCKSLQLPVYPAELGLPDYWDTRYDPLWTAISDADLPICLHIGLNTALDDLARRDPTPQKGIFVPLVALSAAEPLGMWIMGGVFERFPNLKVVFVEPGLGWVAWWLYIVDDLAARQGYEFPAITEPPSHYFHRNVFLTFIDEPHAIRMAKETLGIENIMWSSDYPHPVSSWPNSRAMVQEMFGDADPADRELVVCGNAARSGTSDTVPGVYDGLTVLDLSWGTAGPMTTMFLADHGAVVTRIEPPAGDPFADQSGYRVWNRGKRSARLDLRSDEGRDAFLALASEADLVIESFSIGTTARLGIDHATLAVRNPRLITLSISAYGGHPDHADRPGYDALVAARTGILYDQKGRRGGAMEFAAGRPGPLPEFDAPEGMQRGTSRPGPVFPRTMWPSVGTTYVASLGIAAALRAREVTGRGQHVRTSLLHGALAAVALNWQRVEHGDAPLYWMWPLDSRAIEGLYECADGRWVHHWTVRPKWVLAAAEADRPQDAKLDTAYRDDPDRIGMDADGMVEGTVLHPLLVDAFKKFSSSDWTEAAEEAGIGMALVRSPAEALADPAFLADGCVVELDDHEAGRIRCAGPLMELSATPGAVAGPARTSGSDTEAVLAEADGIRRRGAIASASRTTRELRDGPLTGVRVLDLGLGVAGPFTGRMLADLGADVIKVMALHDGFWAGTHMGLGTNRGKRSIALNLKHAEGRAALERLVAQADVLTVNWRPGAAARLGLDFETLHARYPRLVWCNTRGFEKGPRSDLPGTDQTAAALTGTEWEDGAMDTGNPPLWSRSNMGDTGNALLAAIAITAALYHRDRTGEAQAVSTSIVNAGLLHTSYAWIDSDGNAVDWGHLDAEQTGLGPGYRMYRGSDGAWVFVAALGDSTFATFSTLLTGHADADVAALEAEFATRPAREWWTALDTAGVPAEVVDETFCRTLLDDPHARATGLVSETWAPGVGRFEDPGLLIEFSETPGSVPRGPCQCGEHTRELLREHGYSDDEIDALAAQGAVLDAPVDRTPA